MTPDRIVGLFPKTDADTDLDLQHALQERQTLIEQHTRQIAERAVRTQQPWVVHLGQPPNDPARRELWWRHVDTISAYRERWHITGQHMMGSQAAGSLEQVADRRLAESAMAAALRSREQYSPPDGRRVLAAEPRPRRVGPEL